MQKKIIKDTFFLNIASVIGQGLAFLQSLIILRLLNPDDYGIWLGLNILLVYSSYISLGIEHGVVLRLPYYQGKKDYFREVAVQDTAYIVWTSLSLLFGLCVFGYALWIPDPSQILRSGLLVIGCLVVFEQQISFLGRWSTTALKDFLSYSQINVLRGVVSFCVIVPLSYFFNVYGVVFGTLITSLLTLIVWRTKTSYRFSFKVSFDVLLELFRVGFPMFIVVLGGSLIETIDRMIILSWLGSASLGYYGIVSFGGGSLYKMLAQAGGAMSPHIVEDVGKNDGSLSETKKYLVKPTILFSGAISIIIIGLASVMPFFVQIYLPKYIPGLPAFWLYVPGFFFLSIILTANNIFTLALIARKQQYITILIQVVSIIIEIVISIISIKIGWGIAGVALASTFSYAFYGLSILFMAAQYVITDVYERRRFLFITLIPVSYVVFVMLLLYQLGKWIGLGNMWLFLALNLFVGMASAIPLIQWLNKFANVFSYVRNWLNGLRSR